LRPLLTFNLLELKVINFCHQYGILHLRLYTVGLFTSDFHLDIPKIDNSQFQKWKLGKSIKEF
jgi:hypothetical protein